MAYVDRPHLAKTIRVWRFAGGNLIPVANAAGFTNHRIGEDFISGGMRQCGDGPEMILATANWRDVVAVRFDGAVFTQRTVSAIRGPQSFKAALSC